MSLAHLFSSIKALRSRPAQAWGTPPPATRPRPPAGGNGDGGGASPPPDGASHIPSVPPVPPDEYELKLSMLELYNENLRDLLTTSADRLARGSVLQLVDDPRLGIRVQVSGVIINLEDSININKPHCLWGDRA